MPSSKLLGAAALVAALAGGGVAGALLGTPGVSSAQDGTTTTAPQDGAEADDEVRRDCRFPGIRVHRFLERLETAADAIGVSEQDLRAALADGQSIAQVAEANGVDPQTVIDALVAEATAHLDEAVADGRMTEEEAAELKAELPGKAADFVNREGLPERRHQGFGRGRPGPGVPDDAPDAPAPDAGS